MIDPAAEAISGGINTVYRVGETVHRPLGPHSATVHRLLTHVRDRGFLGAPGVHGIEDGYEVLDFMTGQVPGADHRPDFDGLTALGRLMRAYHDATEDFESTGDDVWYSWRVPPPEPTEVVCHGDIAPYNTVFVDGLPVAFIDFDTARPGPRLWDIGYAAYRFIDWRRGDAGERVRAVCDGYGLEPGGRRNLIDAAVARLDALVAHMRAEAAGGNAAFAAHIADGHDTLYRGDMAFLAAHRDSLTATICEDGATT